MYNLGCEKANAHTEYQTPPPGRWIWQPLRIPHPPELCLKGVFSFLFLSLARLFQASELANICHTDVYVWGPRLCFFLATEHPGRVKRGHLVTVLDSEDNRVLSHRGKSQEELRGWVGRQHLVCTTA